MKPLQLLLGTFSLLLAFLPQNSLGQKETNYWYFGTLSGLNFNSSPPAVLTNGALNTTEGCSAVSDGTTGLLRFYTDGITVWNNAHNAMPNGTGLNGDVSTTQSALIVKKPGSANLYYIFTLPAEGVGNFCYSIVDMSLAGGLGDVTTKNTVIKGNVTEKLSAVHHCNGTDIWVLVHEWNNKSFYAYLLSATGLGTPVVSTTGRVFGDVHGQMKFNNTGTKIASTRDTVITPGTTTFQGIAAVDLFNFNNQTGAVTYSLTLPLGGWQKSYGVEFSPDNSKLYATYYDVNGANGGNSELIQFNLAASNIAASGVTVGASTDPNILRGLQQASNGKVYLSKSNSPFVCTINTPNALGSAASYSDNAIDMDPNSMGSGCMLGLPGFVQSYFHPLYPNIVTCAPTNTVNTSGVAESDNPTGAVVYIDGEKIFVQTSTPQSVRLLLKDINGRLLFEKTFDPQTTGISSYLPELPAGVYLCETISGAGHTHRSKIIKP